MRGREKQNLLAGGKNQRRASMVFGVKRPERKRNPVLNQLINRKGMEKSTMSENLLLGKGTGRNERSNALQKLLPGKKLLSLQGGGQSKGKNHTGCPGHLERDDDRNQPARGGLGGGMDKRTKGIHVTTNLQYQGQTCKNFRSGYHKTERGGGLPSHNCRRGTISC